MTNICIGNNVVINDYACLDAENCETSNIGITIEDNVFIGAGTQVINCGKEMIIRENTNIGSECRIFSDKKTIIEANALLAAYCHVGKKMNKVEVKRNVKKINGQSDNSITKIGEGCWLGVRTHLHSGISVGEQTVVGAHSVVENHLPSQIVAIGNPAKMYYSRV